MSSLQKFDEILKSLDIESKKLEVVASAYRKIDTIIESANVTSRQIEKHTERIKEISEQQKNHQIKTSESLVKLENFFDESKNTLTKLIHEKTLKLNELHLALQRKTTKILSDIEDSNEQNKIELTKVLEESIDRLRKENKDFYKDLESTIRIKLDDNKSEIKKLIENERSQIKQIFEIEFAKNTQELRTVIETETHKQTQLLVDNIKVIKNSTWFFGVVAFILSVLVVLKLWT